MAGELFFFLLANEKGVSRRFLVTPDFVMQDFSQDLRPGLLHDMPQSNLATFEHSNVGHTLKPSRVLCQFSSANALEESDDRNSFRNASQVQPPSVPNANGQMPQGNGSNTRDRGVSPCRDCGESFPYSDRKDGHARSFNHGAWSCKEIGCDRTFVTFAERDAHARRPHTSGHGRIWTPTPNDCVECMETLPKKADLLRHAKEAQHRPYGCECGALFSRLDVLNRHLESFGSEDPKYPCKYCKLHRGPDGFRRLDHLNQHIRNYHHLDTGDDAITPSSRIKYVFPVCSHPDCPQYRDEAFKQLPRKAQAVDKPFHSQSAYTKHMRDEHNECTFPCGVAGCSRTGRRGYFREKDLLNHRRQEHPDAPKYTVTKREIRLRCTEPGCDMLSDPSSIGRHLRGIHGEGLTS